MELAIAAVLYSTRPRLAVSSIFVRALNALAMSRVAILVLMATVLIVRDYKSKAPGPKSLPNERQPLLENGNGSSADYTTTIPDFKPAVDTTKQPGKGWLTYIASFRALFPYLWYSRS